MDQVPQHDKTQINKFTPAKEFVNPANVEQNGRVENYSFPEQRLQQVPETKNILVDNFAVQSNGSLQSTLNPIREHISTPVEETQKHTYASIVCTTSLTVIKLKFVVTSWD